MPPKDLKDKDAGAALSGLEGTLEAHERRLTQSQAEQAGLTGPTEQSAPTQTPTAPSVSNAASEPLDPLAAYLQITDQQRRILEADERFRNFQRNNTWAHVVSDDATVAALMAAAEQRRQRYHRLHEEAVRLSSSQQLRELRRVSLARAVRLGTDVRAATVVRVAMGASSALAAMGVKVVRAAMDVRAVVRERIKAE